MLDGLRRWFGQGSIREILAAEEQMWSLHPQFSLLVSFTLPPAATPTALAVDPAERFFYVATRQGGVYHVPLFCRRQGVGLHSDDFEAVGGGYGAVKVDRNVIVAE